MKEPVGKERRKGTQMHTNEELTGMAGRINEEHRACERAVTSAVEHAVRCGEMLAEAKSRLGHGEWLPWLGANFAGSRQTADVYRKLAANKGLLNRQRAGKLSIRAALTQLEGTGESGGKPYATLIRPTADGVETLREFRTMDEYARHRGYRVSSPLLVDKEFRDLLPPLAPEEYAGLERSLAEDGCQKPIVAWDNIVLDGHARYEICVRRGIKYMVRDVEMEDRLAAKIYIIDAQLGRTNLNPVEKAYVREQADV